MGEFKPWFKKKKKTEETEKEVKAEKPKEKSEKQKEFEANRKKRYSELLKSNKEKGDAYELFVGKHFEEKGYIIKYNGLEQGKKDNTIDLIAINKEEVILIQCKNYKEDTKTKINHEKVKAFFGDSSIYLEKNPQFRNWDIKRLYVISNMILDTSAKKYITENKDLIRYLVLEFKD